MVRNTDDKLASKTLKEEMNITIKLDLTIDKVNHLCAICDSFDFDTNVLCGRRCVDGKSTMGVMGMVGHVVTLAPVTFDDYEVETFYRKAREIGAFKSEE